jgi:ADP-ribose pyrophosphatase
VVRPDLPLPSLLPALPEPPAIALEVVRDRSAESRATGGFFDVRRLQLAARYPDGTTSEPFLYDVGARAALDAVVMAVHFTKNNARHVFLRTALRPPCALRPLPPSHDGSLWELPAGLIEEELGFTVAESAMRELGPWTFPAPGIIGERHLFFHVEVDPSTRSTPSEDGSALEKGAAIIAVPLAEAIEHCRRGAIPDAKTELGLRRLAELA